MAKSQIKFWVFGAFGAVGAYLLVDSISGSHQLALGLTLIAVMVVTMILGGVWDAMKNSEQAATYEREARDEAARQKLLKIRQDGLKQIEQAPVE